MSMQMEFIKVLPSPQALMEDYPISQASKMLKLQRDEEIKNIFTGKIWCVGHDKPYWRTSYTKANSKNKALKKRYGKY